MAVDFRGHPMFDARGFNAPTRFEADIYAWGAGYDDGWIENASGYVAGPSADFPPDGPPTFEFRMWPTVYDIPFHYDPLP